MITITPKLFNFSQFPTCLLIAFLLSLNYVYADLDEISSGQWLRLGVEKEGVYSISAQDLSKYGISISKEQIKTIKLFGQSGEIMNIGIGSDLSMQEQEIIVNTNSDGTLANIIFYGSGVSGLYMGDTTTLNGKRFVLQRHYLNYMDSKNYYLLTYGKTEGQRATCLPTPEGDITSKPTSYKATIFYENDKIMSQVPGSGVLWLGDNIINTVPIVNNLTNYNRTGNVEYVLSVAHTANTRALMKIHHGNTKIKELEMPLVGESYTSAKLITFYATVPTSEIGTDNLSVLKFEYDGLALYPYHNFYEIHYPSNMIAIDNQITFFSNIVDFKNDTELVEYSINGFKGNVYGFDVTNMSKPKLLQNISQTGGFFVFRAKESSDFADIKKYFVSSTINTPTIENISLMNLRKVENSQYANVDMIVIAPDKFIESANSFADYRRKQSGLKISVIPINKIYDEFSYSRLDLAAIRNYIQYAYENWTNPPIYVFLWGTGNYDYMQKDGFPNYIPAYQNRNSNIITLQDSDALAEVVTLVDAGVATYATDDYFVNVDAKDIYQDIAIGRLPITDNTQGHNYINKLDSYENKSNKGNWRRNVLVHADDGPTSGGSDASAHVSAAEGIVGKIPKDLFLNKVYLVDYPVEYQTGGVRLIPKASEELLKQINLVGNLMYIYTGHGSRNTLTHEKTFTVDMLSKLNNSDRLFFFCAFSCEVGRFDSDIGTLSSDIILLPNLGGIASFAASRVSNGGNNNEVAEDLMKHLLIPNENNEYNSIGEASRLTKYGNLKAEAFMYILMGDPSLKLLNPTLNIELTEINGVKPSTEPNAAIKVKGLSHLKVKGNIVATDNNGASKPLTDFNGILNVTLTEPNITAHVIDEDQFSFNFVRNGVTLNSSVCRVVNGEFEADLMVPGDISFSSDNSIIYMYATADDSKQFAKGSYNNIIINDIDTTFRPTETGPRITIHLDSKFFESGDTVARNPLLIVNIWDSTAINTTGLGIGHKIEARIDDSFTPIDLTNSFSMSFEDPKAGDVIQYLYGLEPGYHTITVRAWNVFNNYTETSVGFVIPTDKEEGILNAAFTPNPANYDENIGIAIYYTVPPPIEAEIRVFDMTGKELISTNTTLEGNGYTVVDWNSLNPNGTLIPTTYYYYISFKYDQTRTTYRSCEKFGNLGTITK